MRIYLDNCCFNRPYDDQSQLRIQLETEAKLRIQENIRFDIYTLIWSYILDYENNKNVFQERKEQIEQWRKYAKIDIEEDVELLNLAARICRHGIKNMDSLHIACAVKAKAEYFITTDDGILKKSKLVKNVRIVDPIDFIKEVI